MAGALLALLPLGYLVVRTAEAGDRVWAILARPGTLELVGRSLALVVTVTALCLVLGVGLAALVTRTTLPGRRTVAVLLALPLAVPSYVAAFAWVAAAPWARGFVGATLVLTACTYPYVYLPVVAAMRGVDPAQEEVARSLGRAPWHTFLTVTVRQVWPAAASGALLVALYTLSDFGAVSLLQFDAFTRVIHTSYRASFDRTPAAVLSLLLVVLTVLIALGERRSRRGLEQTRLGSGVSRRSEPLRLGALATSGAAAAVVGVLAVGLAFPVASLVYWFVTGLSAGIDVERLVTSTGTTLLLALLGALVTMALAVPIGVLVARHRSRTSSAIELGAWAGHALPGIVVALALVFFGVRVAQPIYQRTPLLLIAYAVLFLPAGVGAVRAAVAVSSTRVEEVARVPRQQPARGAAAGHPAPRRPGGGRGHGARAADDHEGAAGDPAAAPDRGQHAGRRASGPRPASPPMPLPPPTPSRSSRSRSCRRCGSCTPRAGSQRSTMRGVPKRPCADRSLRPQPGPLQRSGV